MKKFILFPVFILVWSWVGLVSFANAQDAATEQEGKKLEATEKATDEEAAKPEGRKAVVEKLESQFHVDQSRIENLRSKRLGYGEIKVAFSLAQKMPGGINDENINKILSFRQEKKMGWGRVAKELGLQVGSAVSHHTQNDQEADKTHRPEKRRDVEKEKFENIRGPEKSERPERFFKPERPERANHRR